MHGMGLMGCLRRGGRTPEESGSAWGTSSAKCKARSTTKMMWTDVGALFAVAIEGKPLNVVRFGILHPSHLFRDQ